MNIEQQNKEPQNHEGATSIFDILRFKRETRQNSEVRDQMSEVRENLIYDLRFLTSVMDGFNGLSN